MSRHSSMSAQRRAHLDRPVLMRLRIFAIILVVAIGLVVFDSTRVAAWSAPTVGLCFAASVVVGTVASRMLKLSWDAATEKVVGRLDAIGGVILVCYIAFMLLRSRLLGHWLQGAVLGVASLSVFAEAMAGLLLGTGLGIRLIFQARRREEGKAAG